jgi:hypothetical protein
MGNLNLDEIIYKRQEARNNKNYQLADEYRIILENNNIFINDLKDSQEVFYCSNNFFKYKPNNMTNKEYFIFKQNEEKKAEKTFNAWLFTMKQKGNGI